MVNDFLFELGCEELPSGAVWPLAAELAQQMTGLLDKAQLGHGEVLSFATPRRIAVLILDVEGEQKSQSNVRRGPALASAYDGEGNPMPALLGFAKSCGVEVSQLTSLKTEKGEWLVYEEHCSGKQAKELLPLMVNQALAALPIPKPMRWGAGENEFARPVHWGLMLYGTEALKHTVLGIQSNGYTRGHRFHAPSAIEITSPKQYESQLKEAYVIADFAKRRSLIVEQIEQLAKLHHATVVMPEALLDEVTSIVEWPQALIAHFEEEFLDVPSEALIASMQSHQKCFALKDVDGNLLPYFITVANITSSNPQQVVLGNEKVMRARLSDAAFFFRQDKKQPLSGSIKATEQVVFQIKLGTVFAKSLRMRVLMAHLAAVLNLNLHNAERAAELSKCDLMTGMVGEFPELQGLMGYYYALNDGEHPEVAQALNEQYMPRFAADDLPKSDLGMALSLADRLDTIVGIFAIGQKPTGVKDPFKLRRHALAVARMLATTPAAMNVSTLLQEARDAYGDSLVVDDNLLDDIKLFILERLNAYYQGQGVPLDLVLAVRARQDEWLYDLDQRIQALKLFVLMPEAASLSAACKRVNNILNHADNQKEELQDVNSQLFESPAEKELYEHMLLVDKQVEPLYRAAQYAELLKCLASLKSPVDTFFEQVMVMVDDKTVRTNRLALLRRLQMLLQGVADISLIQ